jgi:uncharacterized protein (TIGR02246 family)
MRLTQFAAVLLVAGGTGLSACAPSTEADEAAIRAANKKWLEAIAAKDAKAIAAMHAEDAQMMPANAPKAVGREAIEKAWAGLLTTPGLSLTFETEKFAFAKSGDLAVDIGTYKFTAGEGAAAQTDIGKSVVTWTKRDGKWLVFTDTFNSDAPPAPAPAAPAPVLPSDVAPPEVMAPAQPPAQ